MDFLLLCHALEIFSIDFYVAENLHIHLKKTVVISILILLNTNMVFSPFTSVFLNLLINHD